jgi:hypothetical protein
MNRKILFAIMLIGVLTFGVFTASWVGKFFRIKGDFTPDTSWTLWKPWRVLFDIGAPNSWYQAGIDLDGYLSGSFWLGNVWWGTFNHGVPSVARPRILCSNIVFNDPTIVCPVDGFWWSQNAGWISLSGTFINGWSWVYYNPASWRLEWFGHSRSLGWIPFYAEAATPITLTTQTWVLLNGVWLNFIGKIAIIGNIAGTRIFSVTNQQVGYVFSTINHAEMLNYIRKNIALMSRNASASDLSDAFGTKFNFLIQRGSDYDTSVPWWTWPTNKKSIIIIGGDIILGQQQIGLNTDINRAMIVLKDENGNGWNIFIEENVWRIYSFLYAEWSIYSWEKTITWSVDPYVTRGVWNIPGNQLYINGAIVSKNTIGWSLQNPPTCPVVIANCDTLNSQIYDINYFRTYDYTDPTQKNVPYDDPRFYAASLVIEYNQWLANNPPPWLDSVLQ